MKIMFAVGSYCPSQDGVAMITKYLVEGLKKKGHDVFVFTSAGDGGRQILPKEEVINDVPVKRMRVFVRWPMKLKGIDEESNPQRYIKEIKDYDPDILVVICSQTWTLDWLIPHLDEIKCKKVFYSHGFSAMKDHYPIKELLQKRNVIGALRELKTKRYYAKLPSVLEHFDSIIALSELNNSYIYCKERSIPVKILENAINSRFLDDDMCHTYEDNKPGLQFLYVANYNDNKNQEMLLKAFCRANIENCTLEFTGFEENDYLRKLRDEEKEWNHSGNNNVVFNVHLDREQIYKLYKDSDVFVSVSRSENSPIVHREAAATGMAIISTDTGDVRLLDGIRIVNSDKELTEAIETFYNDRNELSERGKRLRRYMIDRKSTIDDKVDWFEKELLSL